MYPKVTVLMSTYNGEKYIREQLDSILNQTEVEIRLIIRDDGSSDKTISIIKEYAEKNKCVSIIEGRNLGVGHSFWELLKKAPTSDYYAFADQDDVWDFDKLSHAVKVVQMAESIKNSNKIIGIGKTVNTSELLNMSQSNINSQIPVLYGANQLLVDANLKPISYRFAEVPKFDFYSSLSRNILYGCTMVFNNSLRKCCCNVPLPDEKVLKRKNHDAWMLYCAYIMGIVVFDQESKMKYRQHESNVVGGIQLSGSKAIREKIERFLSKKNKKVRSTLASNLLSCFDDNLKSQVKQRLSRIKNANSFWGALELCKDDVIVCAFNESRFKLFLRGILGWI